MKNPFRKNQSPCKLCEGKCNESCLPKEFPKSEGVVFDLTPEQVAKFKAWQSTKPKTELGPIGGHYEVSFLITSIGHFAEVKCWDGTILDLTEYDKL